jgi:Na+/H+-dicarboxylate symporter
MLASMSSMHAWQKLLIGLVAALAIGWVGHGPLGQGAAFVDQVEAQAKAVVRAADLPGVDVRLGRDPLSRHATLSGPADDFQRNGMGNFPGLNQRVENVSGVSGISWDAPGNVVPLLAETLILVALAFAIGTGFGWLLARPKRESFLAD